MRNVTPLRPRKPLSGAERQRRYRAKMKESRKKEASQVTAVTPHDVEGDDASPSPVTPPRLPAAITAVIDSLGQFCDDLEFVRPEQLVDSLDEIDRLGFDGDAELAFDWLARYLNKKPPARETEG